MDDQIVPTHVGRRIKARRIDLGLPQAHVADTLGMTQRQMARLEAGQLVMIRLSTLRALARVLHTSVDDLLVMDDDSVICASLLAQTGTWYQ
jgi:transcriptional regulator with XRE-family HTH domain